MRPRLAHRFRRAAPAAGLCLLAAIPLSCSKEPADPWRGRSDAELRAISAGNLKHIAEATLLYANKFDGFCPPTLEALSDWQVDPKVFLHPRSQAAEAFVSDYDSVFDRGGPALMLSDVPGSLPVAWEAKAFDRTGRNVAFFGADAEASGALKYRAACVVEADKTDFSKTAWPGRVRRGPAAVRDYVDEQLLRYDRVMAALADTDVMRRALERSGGGEAARTHARAELYRRIIRGARVTGVGARRVRVTYAADTPDAAVTVLDRLANHFVAHAFGFERSEAHAAHDAAAREHKEAKAALEKAETELAAFRRQNPGVTTNISPEKAAELQALDRELQAAERTLADRRRKLEQYDRQIESLPRKTITRVVRVEGPEAALLRARLARLKTQLAAELKRYTRLHPAVKTLEEQIKTTEDALLQALKRVEDKVVTVPNPLWEALKQKRAALQAELQDDVATRRELEKKKRALEEAVYARPGLVGELRRLERAKATADARFKEAQARVQAAKATYEERMQRVVTFRLVSPVRGSSEPVPGPPVGCRVEFVTEERFRELMRQADVFLAERGPD